MKLPGDRHGGNVYRIAVETGHSGILDFSASINPLGMPRGARQAIREALRDNAEALAHYPDPEATGLVSAIASRYDIDPGGIIAANGSTELIYLVPRALRPRTVLVTAPTFSEFERSALVSGAKIKRLPLRKNDGFAVDPAEFIGAMKGTDIAVLCNPNNPTARVLGRDSVLEIANAARRSRCVLVVDEAFMDFCPEESVLVEDNPYLIVLRSLTKFYALAGMRLGFGHFPLRIKKRLDDMKEPWSVNTLSQLAGVAALGDSSYASRTLSLIKKERDRLVRSLSTIGLKVYSSSANYILLGCRDAKGLSKALIGKGIAVRDCSNFRGMGNSHIRVAVRTEEDNDKLLEAIRSVIGRVSS